MEEIEKTATLAEILKTDDPQKQLEVVQKLIHLANAPVVQLLITLDTRNSKVTLSGTELGIENLYAVLDAARKEVVSQEVEEKVRTATAPRPASPPEPSEALAAPKPSARQRHKKAASTDLN